MSCKGQLPSEHTLPFVVVTPNYNMAEYLEETIESVLSNKQPGDEYFIVDGGSTDSSVDIIKKYEDRITGWISEPDDGYVDALRKGFEMSSAPLMCWLNSGDLLLPGAFDLVREKFSKGVADLLFGDDYHMDEAGKVLQHSKGYVSNLRQIMLYGGWTPLQDACFWHRSLYESAGGLNCTLRFAGDYDLFLRMSIKGQCEYFPAVLSAFRQHPFQKSIAHAKQYAKERCLVRANAIQQGKDGDGKLCGYFKQLYYGIKVRLRSRVPSMNRRISTHAGKQVETLKAEPTFGN